jgi:hypothetical protein
MEKERNEENNPIFKFASENEPEDIFTQGHVVIKDNYLVELTNSRTKSMYNSRYFNVNENINQPKLYEQLIGKNRQKSYGYNILVLMCFNINMAHFCFPFITAKCGILLTFIILILCALFSYLVQSSLVKYIAHDRNINNCNYAAIIEQNFGSFCASFLEVSVFVWYGILLLVCFITSKLIFFNVQFKFFHSKTSYFTCVLT